jgi:hypothetical protein
LSIEITISSDTATPLLERIKQALGLGAQNRLRIGATAHYAAYVEFGTRRMAAEPYIRPAVDAGIVQVAEALRDSIIMDDSESLDEAGQNIEDMAKSICPVRTGFLRSTIYHEVG